MFDSTFWKNYFTVYDVLNLAAPYQELMAELERELELKSDDIVLDVGSGTGNLLTRIKGKCKKIIGIDNSQEGITIHKSKDSKAEVIFYDITKGLPFPDAYFLKVVSNNTLYTLLQDQQIALMKEIHRVMKPGGKIVISNVKKNYRPIRIYSAHISKSIKQEGLFETLFLSLKIIIPTIKIFYYNNKIKKAGATRAYHFLSAREQEELLKNAGFANISKAKAVYAGQAILHVAYKI